MHTPIQVKLFAGARQQAGRGQVAVNVPPGATAAALREALADQHPALADLARRSRIAVDSQFAADDAPLPLGAEVALIPPVSGG